MKGIQVQKKYRYPTAYIFLIILKGEMETWESKYVI